MNISYEAYPDILSANETEELTFFIINCSGADLVFQNIEKLSAAQYPEYDDILNHGVNAPPGFYLYFFYGDGQSAMTSTGDSVNIEMSLEGTGTENWDIDKKAPSKKVGQYWVVSPKECITFKAGQEVSIAVKNLKVTDQFGQAPVMVMQIYDGEISYHDVLTVKYKTPELLTFGFVEKEYDIHDTVNLAWKVENDIGCRVFVDGIRRYGDKISVAASGDYHDIQIKSPMGEFISGEYHPPLIDLFEQVKTTAADRTDSSYIEEAAGFLSFEEASDPYSPARVLPPYAAPDPPGPIPPPPPPPQKDVTLKWKTHNTVKCYLESKSSTRRPVEGSATIRINESQKQVTLYAQAEDGYVIRQTIDV